MGLIEDIKAQAFKTNTTTDSDTLVIEQTLNKLFYLDKADVKEVEFIQLLMDKNGAQKDRVGLHGSAILASDNDFCYREQVLSLMYKQCQGENISVGLKRIFEEGNAIHEKWQRLFLRGGLGEPEDMDRSRFNKRYDLSYTPDGLITIDGIKYVVEIKSVNTFQFKKMQSHPSGKKQLLLYMHLTKTKHGFVLCDDKNGQDFKIFKYTYSRDEVLPYIERLEAIQVYKDTLLKEHKMVKGICSNPQCKRALKCNMREACFNIGHGRVKL